MVTRPDDVADPESANQWHKLKEEGNKLFKDGSHLKAAAAYTTAIKVWVKVSLSDPPAGEPPARTS